MSRTRVLTMVVAWVVTWGALWLSDADPSAIALAGIVGVIAVVGMVAFDLGRVVLVMRWPAPPDMDEPADIDGRQLPRTLRGLDGEVRSQPPELNQRLVDLVDDRLQANHGVDRHAAPKAADELLTPALRRIVADQPQQPLGQRELWDLLNDIEAL